MLLDSPLNRAALLQVYIHTANNILIEINPQTRIPRTFKRFSGLMGKILKYIKHCFFKLLFSVQLLHKFSVRAEGGPKLLKVIKNPVTDHLPVGIRKIGTSFSTKILTKCSDLVPKNEEPIAVVIGALARGSINVDYIEETVSISNYPLSAALTCTKFCSAFEDAWNVT